MVDYYRDVLMPPLVACFINADLVKIIQTALDVRLKVLSCSADAATYRFPVNPHVIGNGATVELPCHPGNSHVEPFGKGGVRVCPGNRLTYNTMDWTFDPVSLHSQFDKNTTKVEIPPYAWS